MTKLYKLTNQDWETYNHTKWGPCVTHKTSGRGDMCGPGWLHAYTCPNLAILLNPIHANISDPVLWECDGIIEKSDFGLKVGTTQLTILNQIDLPEIGTIQKIAFGILCVNFIYKSPHFQRWARNWLEGCDRSAEAADWAARDAWAAEAAWAAARAARATAWADAWAARAATRAARGAWATELDFDLIALASEALLVK